MPCNSQIAFNFKSEQKTVQDNMVIEDTEVTNEDFHLPLFVPFVFMCFMCLQKTFLLELEPLQTRSYF